MTQRHEWPIPRALRSRAEAERTKFDAVAKARLVWLTPAQPSPDAPAWLDLRQEANPRLRSLLTRAGLGAAELERAIAGARVLELGGSGEATPGFLRAGAARVDQLDVSPGMLDLASARLAEDQRDKVVQHVAAAEKLPFDDGTFDVVYSRHCLHHMRRDLVIPEVARVLAPGGWFLFIEPFLPRWIRGAVTLRRAMLAVDRGTDDPLTPADLAIARRAFAEVTVGGEPNPAVLVRGLSPLARAMARLQRRRPLPEGLLGVVGGRVMVLAREPSR